MGSSNHNEACVCNACTCGRHKQMCKPVIHVETHLDNETEYRVNYAKYNPNPRELGKPQPQQLKVGGEFYGSTENKEKYIAHPTPKVYQHPKDQYIPTPAKLESMTTTKHDYPAWPGVRPPEQKARPGYQPSPAKLESMTTHKADYQFHGPQPVYVHPAQVYVKNENKLEGISHVKADYRDWGDYSKPPPKPKPQFVSPNDDRDFKTTASANYVHHEHQRVLVRPPPHRISRDTKFDGTTTTSVDYQAWPVHAREGRRKAEYVPTPGKLESRSVYTDSYDSKVAERVESMAPKYQPLVTGKFEGVSTLHADYQSYGVVPRREDFKPRNKYDPKKDDRDFKTVMKLDHNAKALPHCHAAELLAGPTENREGHLFVKAQ